MKNLQDKIAVVTGGSRGIGAAIAERLAADGARVVINYTQDERAARALASRIEATGGQGLVVQADVSQLDALDRLVAQTVERWGRIDILVNNAGAADFRPIEQIDSALYARMVDINFRAPFFLMQKALPHMGEGGRVINISSAASEMTIPGASVYAATKAGLETLTRMAAAELGPRQITVNAVAPGLVETDMMRGMTSAEMVEAMVQQTALGRIGQPGDIADVVAFLASDAARWVTGQTIFAHGGLQ